MTILSDSVSDVTKDTVMTGTTLTANPIPEEGDTPDSYTYQWYKRAAGKTESEMIAGAQNETYLVSREDAGCELSVKVTAARGGVQYAPILSTLTTAVVMEAPSRPPVIVSHDYQGATVEGQGVASGRYEYSYAVGNAGGAKIILPDQGATVTVNKLQANTTYYFFTRIPAGEGYEASEWGPYAEVTTDKISIVGPITVSSQKNVGDTVTASAPDTNLQKGNWKAERMNGNTALAVLAVSTSADGYSCQYELQAADVGYQIRFTYTGKDSYEGAVSGTGEQVEKAYQSPPEAPVVVSSQDHSITVKMESGSEKVQFDYQELNGAGITEVSGSYPANTPVIITGLKRNTTYELYARKEATSTYAQSTWSVPLQQKTEQSQVTASVVWTGDTIVDGEIRAAVSGGAAEQTGSWRLERTSSGQTATLSAFTVGADGTLIYQIKPEDTGYQLKATYTGTGDFTGSMNSQTAVVRAAAYAIPDQPEIVSSGDSSVTLKAVGTEGTYQFGYREESDAGEITAYPGLMQAGISLTINGLKRNTKYHFFAKRQAELGYQASSWSPAAAGQTVKTVINGQIRVEGALESGKTLTAYYDAGHYASQPSTADAVGGTWTWTVGSREVSGNTCALLEGENGNTVAVTYHAPADSDFTGQVDKTLGIVQKAVQAAPAVPLAAAAGDQAKGSTIEVTNASADVWYKVQRADNPALPELVKAEDGDKKGMDRRKRRFEVYRTCGQHGIHHLCGTAGIRYPSAVLHRGLRKNQNEAGGAADPSHGIQYGAGEWNRGQDFLL